MPQKLKGPTYEMDSNMHWLSESMHKELLQEWDGLFQEATLKADEMKRVRNKLDNLNALGTKEQAMHYRLLGRLGYNRLAVTDIVHIEHKAKGSFKVNEMMKQGQNMFNIKQVFTALMSTFDAQQWIDKDLKDSMSSIFLSELAAYWPNVSNLLNPRNAPQENADIVKKFFFEIHEILDSCFASSAYKLKEMQDTLIFSDLENNERLLAFFRQKLHQKLKSYRLNLQNLALKTHLDVFTAKDNTIKQIVDPLEKFKGEIEVSVSPTLNSIQSLKKKIQKLPALALYNSQKKSEDLQTEEQESEPNDSEDDLLEDGVFEQFQEKFEFQRTNSLWENIGDPLKNRNLDPILTASIALPSLKKRSLYQQKQARERYLSVDYPFDGPIEVDADSMSKSTDRDPLIQVKQLSKQISVQMVIFKASERIPKSLINLDSLPQTLRLDISQKFIEKIDSDILNQRKIREIYSNIFNSLGQNFFEADLERANNVNSCPTMPVENGQHLVLFNQNEIDLDNREQSQSQQSIHEKSQNDNFEIRMITRDAENGPNVTVDDFITDRKDAMKRVVSSRYGGKLKYNYGGYVPASFLKNKKKKNQEQISSLDYLKFVNNGLWDFVLHVVIDERADAMARQRQKEETLKRKTEEEKRKLTEKIEQEKIQRRQKLSQFNDGMWNPGVLEYLYEIQERDTNRIRSIKKAESMSRRKSFSKQGMQKQQPTLSRNRSKNSGSVLSIDPSDNTRTDSMIDLTSIQRDLEDIWKQLQVPTSEKIDMAVKYSSVFGGSTSEKAIEAYKFATRLILDREHLLDKLEWFEREASNPERFFADKNSKPRLQESEMRQMHLRDLKEIEQELEPVLNEIYTSYNDQVTFQGRVYKEKMKKDYLEMLHRLEKERKSG